LLQHTITTKILGLTIGCFFAFTTSGYCADVLYHGTLCQSSGAKGGQPSPSFSQWGVGNLSTSQPLVVNCGGAIESQSQVKAVSVIVYDRNPSSDVRCRLTLVDDKGTHFWVGNLASTANQLPETLMFTNIPPVNAHTISLQCFIPPMKTPKEVSYVTTYHVITTP
jgi:hypothetical protein